MKNTKQLFTTAIAFAMLAGTTLAQDPQPGPGGGNRGGFDRGGRGAPGGQGNQGGNRFGGPPGGQGNQGGSRFGGQGGSRFGGGRGGPPTFPIIAALDKNGDGEISKTEIDAAVAALKTLDKNKDGKLTRDEMMPDFSGRGGPGGGRQGGPGGGRGGRGGFSGPPGGQGGPGGQSGNRFGGPPGGQGGRGGFGGPPGGQRGGQGGSQAGGFNFADRIMVHDKDKDGKVSKAELPTRMQSLLTRGDLNKDGFIDKDEAAKMAASMSRGSSGGGDRSPRGGQGGGRPQRPQFDK